jgi:hypothetical protein
VELETHQGGAIKGSSNWVGNGRNIYTTMERTLGETNCRWTAAMMNRQVAYTVHELNEQHMNVAVNSSIHNTQYRHSHFNISGTKAN